MTCSLPLAERVRELSHNTANALQKLLAALPEFDASNEWMANGSASCPHWLAAEIDTELCTARDYLRVAKKLAEFPTVAAAYAAGVLSFSNVRTLTRYATAENVNELLAIAEAVTAAQLTQAIGAWLAKNEQPDARDKRDRGATALCCRHHADGTTRTAPRPSPGHFPPPAPPRSWPRSTPRCCRRASHPARPRTIRQKLVVKERYRTCVDYGRHELLTYDHNPAYEGSQRTIVDELETRCWPCHRKRQPYVVSQPATHGVAPS